MSDYSNHLIYGKNETTQIVSIEPTEDGLVLIKEVDGDVVYEVIPTKYWMLTNQKVSSRQSDLDGNQHYKYMAEFDTLKEKMDIRKVFKANDVDYWDIFNPIEASMVLNGLTYFKGLHPKDVSVLFWDIETTGLVQDETSKVLLISNTFRKKGKIVKKLFAYDEYKSQKQLIDAWCKWVREIDPSIVCGHNILGYDLQYMRHCAKMNKTYLRLGRDESVINFDPYTSSYRVDGSMTIDYFNGRIFGREIVDTMFLSRKYDIGKKYVSYGLKAIIESEGLEKKDRQFYDAGEIRNNYTNPEEWLKIKAYAIDDADDAMSLFDLMAPSLFYMTQNVSKPFQSMVNSASGSQINNMMIRSYLQIRHSIAKASEITSFEGGISLGVPGLYKNALKWDIVSAYPHTIIQFNLNDDTKDPRQNFLTMVKYFTKSRIDNKKLSKSTGDKYYEDLQQSMKIIINSFFGACGAPGLNYNCPHIASRITKECRSYIESAVRWATGRDTNNWRMVING